MLCAENARDVIRRFHSRSVIQHHVFGADDVSRNPARSHHHRIEWAGPTRDGHRDSLKGHQNVAHVYAISTSVDDSSQGKIRLCEHDLYFPNVEIMHPEIDRKSTRLNSSHL